MSAQTQPPGWLEPVREEGLQARRTVTTVEGNVSMTTYAGMRPRKKPTSALSDTAAKAPKTAATPTTATTAKTRKTTKTVSSKKSST